VPPLATEQDFVMLALRGGRAEVRLAGLAEKNAARAELKEFAATMVKDHTVANGELKTIAEGLKVLLPDVPDKEVEATYKKLSELKGEKFDIAFLAEVAKGHTDDATLYEGGRKIAKSKEVIAYIDKTLPVIRKHIDMVSALTKKSAP
jgi:putative membrane protein